MKVVIDGMDQDRETTATLQVVAWVLTMHLSTNCGEITVAGNSIEWENVTVLGVNSMKDAHIVKPGTVMAQIHARKRREMLKSSE